MRRRIMSLLKKGTCGACGEDRYIVNRKHMCCAVCNKIRMHGTDKPQSKIRQKSSKQASKDKAYHDVKMDLIREAEDDGTYYCRGCGNTHSLSLSHLIRRSRRPELTDVKENMTFHCLVRQDGGEGCHQRWETVASMVELEDFDDNMRIILRLDPEYYWIVVNKLRSLGFKINIKLHK
jgi:hypothetical protein